MAVIWVWTMALSVSLMLFTSPSEIISSLTAAASSSLTLCVSLTAVYCLWMGMTQILKDCGAISFLGTKFKKPIEKLFDTDNPAAVQDISTNLAANLIGAGNAATPAAISAIRRMDDGKGKIGRGPAMLFAVNTVGFQLFPTTLIGIRAAMGSKSPADIILPNLLVSLCMTAVSILLVCIFFPHKSEQKGLVLQNLGLDKWKS